MVSKPIHVPLWFVYSLKASCSLIKAVGWLAKPHLLYFLSSSADLSGNKMHEKCRQNYKSLSLPVMWFNC